MRLIYTDEAGTSANEPVCVVAAVIVDGDKEVNRLERDVEKIIQDKVPKRLQENFCVHGAEIFHGKRPIDRKEWQPKDRLEFLSELLQLPRAHQVPIAIAMEFKNDWESVLGTEMLTRLGLTSNQYSHSMTFSSCMARADYFLERYLNGRENGIVIAENVPEMKKHLLKNGLVWSRVSFTQKSENLRKERWPKECNIELSDEKLEIKNIIEAPFFVEKADCKITQLADLLAFGFRRCLEKRSYGNDMVMAALGPAAGSAFINEPAWFSVASSGLFNNEKYLTQSERDFKERMLRVYSKETVEKND